MSNGCGCQKGALRWFRPPYAKFFYVPCCMHDDEYDRGGGLQERKEADRNLFYNCFKLIEKNRFSPEKTLWVAAIALCYYWSVRLLGGNYFKYRG